MGISKMIYDWICSDTDSSDTDRPEPDTSRPTERPAGGGGGSGAGIVVSYPDINAIKFKAIEPIKIPEFLPCEYCGGTTRTDDRGHCCACGGARNPDVLIKKLSSLSPKDKYESTNVSNIDVYGAGGGCG